MLFLNYYSLIRNIRLKESNHRVNQDSDLFLFPQYFVLFEVQQKKILKESSQKRETKEKNSEWSGMEEWIRGGGPWRHSKGHLSFFYSLLVRGLFYIFSFLFQENKKLPFSFLEERPGPPDDGCRRFHISTPIDKLLPFSGSKSVWIQILENISIYLAIIILNRFKII